LHGSLAYHIWNPIKAIKSRLDLHYLQKYAGEFAEMHGDIHRFDAAREVHERMSQMLGDKSTFYGELEEEIKEQVVQEGGEIFEDGGEEVK